MRTGLPKVAAYQTQQPAHSHREADHRVVLPQVAAIRAVIRHSAANDWHYCCVRLQRLLCTGRQIATKATASEVTSTHRIGPKRMRRSRAVRPRSVTGKTMPPPLRDGGASALSIFMAYGLRDGASPIQSTARFTQWLMGKRKTSPTEIPCANKKNHPEMGVSQIN